ncbi:hypothetical protein SA3033_09690 [Aggregatibacter actinomycetemcomitans serotype d str. SA3033]|nr:hypothetical protein SA2876_05735 [Aggregatibacter actinomycetemcomitans serotype e str. SA2876]KYK82864.1 hypothetical protein SA3033_09690 [Aggregatibacter actinomycetemcomitans serotype d str. SA3033]KYK86756.1 hypothetical protein SA508_07595 [Aggregatibacter actinomycetemcomitans serotype d str. SA508]
MNVKTTPDLFDEIPYYLPDTALSGVAADVLTDIILLTCMMV